MKKILASLVLSVLGFCAFAQNDYQAAYFGTQTDGITDNTGTIQRAIDFISEKGGGTLTFTVGRYLTSAIELKSNVTISIREGAVILAKPSVYSYNEHNALIYADGAENIAVIGKGSIDGNAQALKADSADQLTKGYIKSEVAPVLIDFTGCSNAKVEEIRLTNPAVEKAVLGVQPVGVYTYFYETGTCITPDGRTIKVQK